MQWWDLLLWSPTLSGITMDRVSAAMSSEPVKFQVKSWSESNTTNPALSFPFTLLICPYLLISSFLFIDIIQSFKNDLKKCLCHGCLMFIEYMSKQMTEKWCRLNALCKPLYNFGPRQVRYILAPFNAKVLHTELQEGRYSACCDSWYYVC